MEGEVISNYSFNVSTPVEIEAKCLDYLWGKADMTGKMHRTDFYHFIWIEEGEFSLNVDFEELHLRSGDAFLISPGQVCSFSLVYRPQAFSVLFVPEFLGEAATDTQLLHHISRSSPLDQKIIPLQGLPIGNLLRQLIIELQREADAYQMVVARSCLRILLAEVARRIPQNFGVANRIANTFFDAVEERYSRLYNVSDYLSLLSVQEKVLTQAVRSAIGLTPKMYLDQRRMLEAKRLLAYSKLSIKEIAFTLGFDEPTNFNKFFRKHLFITPNEFRNRYIKRL